MACWRTRWDSVNGECVREEMAAADLQNGSGRERLHLKCFSWQQRDGKVARRKYVREPARFLFTGAGCVIGKWMVTLRLISPVDDLVRFLV